MRIAEGDNTAQYWPNLVSQQSAIVIGPVLRFTTVKFWANCSNLPYFSQNLAQYRPYTKPIVTFTMASSIKSIRPRVRPMNYTLLGHVSLLLRQTILEVRKLEFGTASAHFYAENKCWRPESGQELETFWPMLGQRWVVSNFAFG